MRINLSPLTRQLPLTTVHRFVIACPPGGTSLLIGNSEVKFKMAVWFKIAAIMGRLI